MKNRAVNTGRRNIITRGLAMLGVGLGGSAVTPMLAGCQSNQAGESRYLKHADILDKCFSAVLQDVMDPMGLRDQCMAPEIKPLQPGMRAWGEVRTIYLEAVDEVPEHPFQLEMELLDDTRRGQIIVARCDTGEMSAFWGGLLTNAAVGHGAHGVIMDGGARDYEEIVELGFPVFSAGLIPYDSLGRMDGKAIDVPITCGGVKTSPGDLVFGDVNGIVVVPKDVADEVIAKAWEKVKGESTVREELRSGASVVETFKKYGIL